ncbi:hypothetical protein [Paenibacillus gansuensis]|uniref:Uncharacterized protein n=1 Tax=Paenibacillus gansuensis TaxID=306542 RepID=A0ABW5P707_9BACL
MASSDTIDLTYLEWDESRRESSSVWLQTGVAQGELFLAKLVNATLFRNRLGEHVSNETDQYGHAAVYIKPWMDSCLPEYGAAVREALFDYCDVSEQMEMEYWRFEEGRFTKWIKEPLSSALAAASILLDHYRTIHYTDYEVLYAVHDLDRKKVVMFLKQTDE